MWLCNYSAYHHLRSRHSQCIIRAYLPFYVNENVWIQQSKPLSNSRLAPVPLQIRIIIIRYYTDLSHPLPKTAGSRIVRPLIIVVYKIVFRCFPVEPWTCQHAAESMMRTIKSSGPSHITEHHQLWVYPWTVLNPSISLPHSASTYHIAKHWTRLKTYNSTIV